MGAKGSEEAIEKRLEELKRMEHDLDYDFDAMKSSAPISSPSALPTKYSGAGNNFEP